jgi:hypothetical protein
MLRYKHIANHVHYLRKTFCIGQQLQLMTSKGFTIWKVNFNRWRGDISLSGMVTVVSGMERSYCLEGQL